MRYDDDSENEEDSKFLNKNMKKVANNTVGGVKRVARGTRRMSLAAAGNVKKVASGTVKVAGGVAGGAASAVTTVTKKKKKKKKKSKKDRGRSESPRRTSNSKPPVTKPGGGFRSLFSPKRWRSASPMVGRGKAKTAPEEPPPLTPLTQPLPSFSPAPTPYQQQPMMNLNKSENSYGQVRTMPPPSPYDNGQNNIGMSIRSLSSNQKHQRNLQQEKIEKDSEIPFLSVMLHSGRFLKYCDIAFDLVDTNKDGAVDETELYAGLLLIHLKLGSFLGPAACKPLSRDRCSAMFQRFDSTNSGGLDRTEFRRVMMVLFTNVFVRVLVQFALTIIIVPLIAKRVLAFLTIDSDGWWDYWTKPRYLRKLGVEFTLDDFMDWRITSYPSNKRTFFTKVYRFFRIGSDEFWETFPLTFLTVILGLVIAPYVLFYFDDMFQYAVDWKENRRVGANKSAGGSVNKRR